MMTTISDTNQIHEQVVTVLWKASEGKRSRSIPDKYRSPEWYDREGTLLHAS